MTLDGLSDLSVRPVSCWTVLNMYMFEFPSATQRPAVRHDWLLSFGIDETEAEIEPDYPAEDLLE